MIFVCFHKIFLLNRKRIEILLAQNIVFWAFHEYDAEAQIGHGEGPVQYKMADEAWVGRVEVHAKTVWIGGPSSSTRRPRPVTSTEPTRPIYWPRSYEPPRPWPT